MKAKHVAISFAVVVAFLAVDARVAKAGAIGDVGGGGGGVASALVCLLTGDSGCTMTGGIIFSGVASPDITAAGSENLSIFAGTAGTGSVQIGEGDGQIDLISGTGATNGIIDASSGSVIRYLGTLAALAGSTSAPSNTQNLFTVCGSGCGGQSQFSVYGGGIVHVDLPQAATCAAGVLALNPTSSVVNIDANGAACVVTIAETTAASIGPGFDVQINIVTSAGAGAVTFPNVANIHAGPTLCTTTGLAINGSYAVHYANKVDDMFIGKSCQAN